jgi:molybdopterin converting factor subunit 1
MKLLYFAWVRTAVGAGEEDLDPPAEVATVGQLLDWLAGRSEGHGQALADPARVRVAVNQSFAAPEDPVAAGDEVAIFPPVTGG